MLVHGWDLGTKDDDEFSFSARKGDGALHPVDEFFRVVNYSKGVVVRAIRPRDHVVLTFVVLGYKCTGYDTARDTPRLLPRPGGGPYFLGVILPPQHIAEQISEKPGACSEGATLGAMRIRLSQPSRLVFKILDKDDWKPTVRVDEMTDWSKLLPLVQDRADVGPAVMDQLGAALKAIPSAQWQKLSLTAALVEIGKQMEGPKPTETALEMAGRLIFSPSSTGRWLLPAATTPTAKVPLWTARLDRAGRMAVRAMWSNWLEPNVIPRNCDQPAGVKMLSLNFRNHWEIVGQTSIYGLPALRRIDAEGATGEEVQARDLPRATVVRPNVEIGYLDEIDCASNFTSKDSGIALANPFHDADIELSALGGSFRSEWKGDPANIFLDPKVMTGFQLERLNYTSFLGRDSRVVAVEKGYLFPLGIRASLVTVHERNIYPDKSGKPISYLVERRFITTSGRRRTYPGPYHPYEGREFPVDAIELKTLATPDLAKIENIPLVLPDGEALPSESVFWPQVMEGAERSDVVFEWATQDAISVKSKLAFVMNSVVGNASVMRALVEYYNAADLDVRTARFDGARHRYAAPLPGRDGETSFDTSQWLMRARGRQDAPGGGEHFALDGRMEGADQPPFYPAIEHALINAQSVDQMLGTPQGAIEVSFFRDYVERGFVSAHGIYLKLAGQGLAVDAAARTDRSGGLASPSVNIAAISRISGPVGGGAGGLSKVAGAELDFEQAEAGLFDPAEFFDDAKLLGVVSLKDVIEVGVNGLKLDHAPRLIENFEHGSRGLIDQVKLVAKDMKRELYGSATTPGIIADLETGIKAADNLLGGAQLNLKEVYPSLIKALGPFRDGNQPQVNALLNKIIAAGNADTARKEILKLAPILQQLVAAAAATLKDPVPDAFKDVVTKVREFLDDLISKATDQLRNFAQLALSELENWLEAAFCDAIDKQGFGEILFGEAGKSPCPILFSDPEAALRAFARGLFGTCLDDMFGAMQEVLQPVFDLRARLDLTLDETSEGLLRAIDAAVKLIEDRLAPLDTTVKDVRDASERLAVAKSLLDGLRKKLEPPALPDPKDALKHVDGIARTFSAEARKIIEAELAKLGDKIHPVPGEDADLLLAELSALALQRIEAEMVVPLVARAAAQANRIERFIDERSRDGFARVIGLAVAQFDAILKSRQLAEIARAGRNAIKVRDEAAKVVATLGDAVMAPSADLEKSVRAIQKAAGTIVVPPGPPGAPLRQAIAGLQASSEAVLGLIDRIQAERDAIKQLAGDIVDYTKDYLTPLARIVALRRQFGARLRDMAVQCAAIDRLFKAGNSSQADRKALAAATRGCAMLFLGALGIDLLGQHISVLRRGAKAIKDEIAPAPDYIKALEAALATAENSAQVIKAQISAAIDPATLEALAKTKIAEFEAELDRRVTGLLLQAVGFTAPILSKIDDSLKERVASFCTAVLPVYDILATLGNTIVSVSYPSPLDKVFILAIGGPKAVMAVKSALGDLDKERNLVANIAAAPDLQKAAALAASYRNGTGALVVVGRAIEQLTLVDIGQALARLLRDQLRMIEEEARTLIRQFVPTRIETRYFWTSELKAFPSEADYIFKPDETIPLPSKPPSTPPLDHPARNTGYNWHLWLDGRFTFDILSGKREMVIQGTLRPFELRLLGGQYHMLSIFFDETRFVSENGSAPKFDVKVRNVAIGPFLKFIEALQKWLSPQGSGFYITPTGRYPGIEVGYIYDAGIIQIGSLQFLNVAFRVAAALPFSNDSVSGGRAIFTFALAGPERPFLIANPPYGGGGWVVLKCDTDQVRELDLAFVFGGVAALKFGPLDAQGRIVAGVRVQSMMVGGKTAYAITAIFEAVGEGNIACFSISVSIRVTLTQETTGALYGETTYRFTFKVGFAKFKYKVTANYRLNNRKGAPLALIQSGMGSIHMTAPPKAERWQSYRAHFDLSLLVP